MEPLSATVASVHIETTPYINAGAVLLHSLTLSTFPFFQPSGREGDRVGGKGSGALP